MDTTENDFIPWDDVKRQLIEAREETPRQRRQRLAEAAKAMQWDPVSRAQQARGERRPPSRRRGSRSEPPGSGRKKRRGGKQRRRRRACHRPSLAALSADGRRPPCWPR